MKNASSKYKIAFLIPVFEKIDCVEDQIQNIHTICPNSVIIFHVNSVCSDEYYQQVEFLVNYYDFCFLLKERFPSNWGSGFLVNVYYYAIKWFIINSIADYLFITHSNSLLINPKLEKNIYDFDFYFNGSKALNDLSELIKIDKTLLRLKEKFDIHVNNVDGTAMNYKVASEVENILKDFLIDQNKNYASEEYYLSSIFEYIKSGFIYKGVTLERWGHVGDNNINYYDLQVEKSADYIVDLMLNNQYDVLAQLNIFSLKRVARDYNDRTRILIRDHFGYNNQIY